MATLQENKKHPIIMHVHSMIRLYSSRIIAVTVFILIFITGSTQFSVRTGLTFAVVDTLWIVLTKTLFDRFFNSRFFQKSFTMLNILLIFSLISCMVTLMNVLEFTACRLLLPTMQHVEPIYTIVRDGFWIVGAFLASLVLWSEENIARQEMLISAKNDLELKLLRSQIGPHFIFNALNNIYSLVYTKNDKAPEMILQLSDMLRYTVDFSQADQVEVEKECTYIENYINFQHIRLGGDVPVRFRTDIRDASAGIPPMLLQPFVENCFVHGDLSADGKGVDISLYVDHDQLVFRTENAKRSASALIRKKHDSTGIANVRQRLQLYYNKDFTLQVEDLPDLFRIHLQIDFQSART